jgi:glycosyltransferase involved in cell wall biosynthesis
MRILNVNTTLDPIRGGGTAERTYRMHLALTAAGVESRILTLDVGDLAERKAELGPSGLTTLPLWNKRYNVPRDGHDVVRTLIAEADVVHLMGHWNWLNVRCAAEARRLRKPYVVCPAGELPLFGRSRGLKKVFNIVAGRRVVQRAALHIAVTESERAQFEPYGVARDSVVVMPNGICARAFRSSDTAAFRLRHGLGDRSFVLFMGRLNPIKGPDLLLEAFLSAADRFPDIDLVFAGPDGGLADELRRRAAEHSAGGRVRFLGYLGGEEKSQAYHAAELLVVPSRSEAMSIVALEAGICGKPVLMTDRCGFDEVAEIGGGCVVRADVAALAAGLVFLLKDRPALPNLGRRLSTFVAEQYSWTRLAARYVELYRRLA